MLLLVYLTTATSILKLAHVLEVTCTLKYANILAHSKYLEFQNEDYSFILCKTIWTDGQIDVNMFVYWTATEDGFFGCT